VGGLPGRNSWPAIQGCFKLWFWSIPLFGHLEEVSQTAESVDLKALTTSGEGDVCYGYRASSNKETNSESGHVEPERNLVTLSRKLGDELLSNLVA